MRNNKTQQIVYGAMMLAIYSMFMLLDRYSGGMLYIFLYYFLPLPFVVYGLRYGTNLQGAMIFCSIVLGFMLGLPETAFFGVTAVTVSYIIVSSIKKNWSGTVTVLFIMIVTILSQILSVTIFASLFGYNMAEEIQYILSIVQEVADQLALQTMVISEQRIKVIFAFSTILMGCLEAFLFTTLSDMILLRLKMARVPKFSLYQLRIPKIVGILFIIVLFLQTKYNTDLVLFSYLTLWMMILAQGLSYCFFLNATIWKKPKLNALAFLGCFIPIVNYFITCMGLIDIFNSGNREKILYNIIQRGE